MSDAPFSYDTISGSYDRDHFGLQAANHEAGLAQLRDAGFAGTTALDIGCGTGNFLVRLHQAYPAVALSGLDPSAGMLEIAATKVPASYQLGTAATADFERPFDLVSFHFVLAYERLETLLDFSARHLAPGGHVLIGTTTLENFPDTFARCDFLDFQVLAGMLSNPATFDELRARIESHGAFRIADHRPYVRDLIFPTADVLHDFIFNSGWASDMAIAFREQFTALVEHAEYPYRDRFLSHSLLLARA